MHGLLRSIFATLLLLSLVELESIAQEEKARPVTGDVEAPIYVLIEGENSLEAIRDRLDRPDFVILKGSRYDELKRQAEATFSPSPLRYVVESVVLTGEVLADQAPVTFDMRVVLTGNEATWVPIRLDGKTPTSAREAERELPLRVVDKAWQVKVEGDGPHQVKVVLNSRVQPSIGSPEGRRLEWSIPEAATTRVQLVMSSDVIDVEAMANGGSREPLLIEQVEGGQRIRASASLPPQKKLELFWRIAAEKNPISGPPLLTAQGEISLEVERGSIRSRSSWDVRSERGSVRELSFRLEPTDELLGLECDGRPVIAEGPTDTTSGVVVVPLTEPLRPGKIARLIVTSRRAISPDSTANFRFRGVPLLGVIGQTGVIAISQRGGDTWVSASPGRGLKQIDPRSDLPDALRSKPSTVLAFQFVEQPFDLGLQVDPSPPWVQVKSRTTITLAAGRAWVDAWFDYNVPRGRVFEARIQVPEAMTVDLIGPQATVESSELLAAGTGPNQGKTLVARLNNRASLNGFFAVHLSGWQVVPVEGEFRIGLPSALDAQSRGGLIAVVTDRGTSIEIGNTPEDPGTGFSTAGLEPPTPWSWPTERPPGSFSPALWLRHDNSPTSLPVKTITRPRVVQETTTIEAQIDTRRLDVRQSSSLQVQNGVLPSVEILVPRKIEGLWELEGTEVHHMDRIGDTKGDEIRYRLTLAREVADRCQIGFRIRQTLARPLNPDSFQRIEFPRIRFQDVVAEPPFYRVAAVERVDVKPDGAGWAIVADDRQTSLREFLTPARLEKTSEGVAAVLGRAHELAVLPRLVASRVALKTSLSPSGVLRTSAAYRVESHDGTFVAALPLGAIWERATVGGESVSEVESMDGTENAYRIKLTSGSPTPIVVAIDFTQPWKSGAAWRAPRLLEGGIVQECYWETRIPWNVALLGVPQGWSDANQWNWNLYAFIRQPSLSGSQLAAWIGPNGSGSGVVESNSQHAYLFTRVGDPADLNPHITSRAALVGSCSGIVMIAGLGLLMVRGWGRVAWFLLPVAGVVVAAILPWNLILVMIQSSLVGALLVGAAALTQRFVERRMPPSRGFEEPLDSAPARGSASGRGASMKSEPDESTVIRGRPGTTVDHNPAVIPVPEGSHPA